MLVIGEAKGFDAVYWTGRTLGRWPEYVRDHTRAANVADDLARDFACQFRELWDGGGYHWKALPA